MTQANSHPRWMITFKSKYGTGVVYVQARNSSLAITQAFTAYGIKYIDIHSIMKDEPTPQ